MGLHDSVLSYGMYLHSSGLFGKDWTNIDYPSVSELILKTVGNTMIIIQTKQNTYDTQRLHILWLYGT